MKVTIVYFIGKQNPSQSWWDSKWSPSVSQRSGELRQETGNHSQFWWEKPARLVIICFWNHLLLYGWEIRFSKFKFHIPPPHPPLVWLVCSKAELQFFLNWLLPPLACTYIYTYIHIHIHKQYINDCHRTIPSADTCVASCKLLWNRRFKIKFCVKIWAYSRLTVYFRINREVRRYEKIYGEYTQQLLTCRCRRLWNCVSSRTLILCLQKPVTLDVDV